MRDRLATILNRCLRLRCPVCGQSSIVRSAFHIRHHCPSCRALFQREDGFFVGAIAVNVLMTEAAILFVYIACLPVINTQFETVLTILLVMALLFPIANYHHSWSVWLAFDHLIEKLPKIDERGRTKE